MGTFATIFDATFLPKLSFSSFVGSTTLLGLVARLFHRFYLLCRARFHSLGDEVEVQMNVAVKPSTVERIRCSRKG